MKFSNMLWETTLPIYEKIINHPFNCELAKGTLNRKRFEFYIQQDAFYLIGFSRALALIAGRSNSSKLVCRFLNFALDAIVSERELHAIFSPSTNGWDDVNPSPSCMAYTQYLIATASTVSLEEAVSAVLPCFWIYHSVGNHIASIASKDNPYIEWIKTYTDQKFSESTEQAISTLDELADQSSKSTLSRMKNTFEKSVWFEWHFWNDAYNMPALHHDTFIK